MIMKFGTGTVTSRDDVNPDVAPLTKAAALTEGELRALVDEEPTEGE